MTVDFPILGIKALMKKITIALLAMFLVGCAQLNPDLVVQKDIDLRQYAGTWYEQARLPNRFQSKCVGDVQADYVLQEEGSLQVTNQCRLQDGSVEVAVGEGRLAGGDSTSKLEVRFAPSWLSWLPMVWGDYWIIQLQGDYQYSLVGTPNREYLWVLSRDKEGDKETVQVLLEYAAEQGFDTSTVVMAP